MSLFFSRYSGLLLRNATWRLFSGPKHPWSPGLSNARIGVRMAHIVPPPVPPSSSLLSNERVARTEAIVSQFNDLFRSSPPDLVEQLLSTITPNPGFEYAIALSFSLYTTESLDASIRSVVQVLPRAPDIVDPHFDINEPRTFRDMFKMLTTYCLWSELSILNSEQETDVTTRRVLYAALFSASAVKNGLLDADCIYAFTRLGLLLSDSESLEDDKRKMFAVMRAGACLQLITAGSVFMEKHFAKNGSSAVFIAALEGLIHVLEGLRVKRSMHPRGLELLEKTIQAAKSNFANPLSAPDAWKILFPNDKCSAGFGVGDQ